jgi:hypothetical protein
MTFSELERFHQQQFENENQLDIIHERMSQKKLERPAMMKYWTREDVIVDDGSEKSELLNMLRRKVAELRSQLSRLQVAYNDLKAKSKKEIEKLQKSVGLEKKKRLSVQEDKLEKSSALI